METAGRVCISEWIDSLWRLSQLYSIIPWTTWLDQSPLGGRLGLLLTMCLAPGSERIFSSLRVGGILGLTRTILFLQTRGISASFLVNFLTNKAFHIQAHYLMNHAFSIPTMRIISIIMYVWKIKFCLLFSLVKFSRLIYWSQGLTIHFQRQGDLEIYSLNTLRSLHLIPQKFQNLS